MIIATVLGLIVLSFIAFLLTEKGNNIRNYINFFITGLDSGFNIHEIFLLGKAGNTTGLKDLTVLYWSLPALDRCTQAIILHAKQNATENDPKIQKLLSSLYRFRTKVELEQAKKRIGLQSTKEIIPGQKIRIVLKGVGIYASTILKNNGTNLLIEYPKNPASSHMPPATSISWIGKNLTIYFWRSEDAGYEFETNVLPVPTYSKEQKNKAVLFLAHSRNFIRTQKRKSIRAKSNIYAQLYIISTEDDLNHTMETEPGMKCLIEDISEDGAMVLIGGKAIENLLIKLQFMINDVLIIMAGFIKGVQFDKEKNQSRVHFESNPLPERMKNAILTYVYNIIPESQRQEFDALRLSEQDEQNDSEDQTEQNEIVSNEESQIGG